MNGERSGSFIVSKSHENEREMKLKYEKLKLINELDVWDESTREIEFFHH